MCKVFELLNSMLCIKEKMPGTYRSLEEIGGSFDKYVYEKLVYKDKSCNLVFANEDMHFESSLTF